CQQYNSDPSF
nr:immunoglobulin light chain junction region [Macaca mulatta]MOW53089.1 immunoglobulin light chain junction region [Macaca mulatta]MOW53116.1 immunoglobulin light chain junction region [Macaca mulatta]MOW53192.1 immunoglobulin light chain junction region [Macaca mulatta]MOW54955.1 immunoglobulin light chain junction region [Macaca mulatta]